MKTFFNIIFGVLLSIHSAWCVPLAANRLSELNQEYSKGRKLGQYGFFVSELKEKLQKTKNLKEATRLATLIRDYTHGKIIPFDTKKRVTPHDWECVLDAHATVTSFLTLSPLGTDRYREDTLRYAKQTVQGKEAQELTMVADATQAFLWANPVWATNQNNGWHQEDLYAHVRQEVFLRWMDTEYQQGGGCDVSPTLGHWTYHNHTEAKHMVESFLTDERLNQLQNSARLNVTEEQIKQLQFKEGTTINVPGTRNQCGFFSTGKPSMRHQDAWIGPHDRFIKAFERAYYDPELFWMLVAFCGASSWPEKQYDCLRYEKTLQENPEVKKLELEQHAARYAFLEKEFDFLLQFSESNINKEAVIADVNSLQSYIDKNKALEGHIRWAKNKLREGKKIDDKWTRETLSPFLESSKEGKAAYSLQDRMNRLRAKIFRENFIKNSPRFNTISQEVKRAVVTEAQKLAIDIFKLGGGQMELNPGADVEAGDALSASIDTFAAYLNNRSLNVLCTEAVMLENARLGETKKIGGYYLGKVITNQPFAPMYTVNHGDASFGHYQLWISGDTPPIAIANALRNPTRKDKSWSLVQEACEHAKNSVPGGNSTMLQNWFNAYIEAS